MILHTHITLDPTYGGPARTVPALCDAVAQTREVSLISTFTGNRKQETGGRGKQESAQVSVGSGQAKSFELVQVGDGSYRSFATAIEQEIENTEIIHDHGAWLPNNLASFKMAKKHNKPFILTTRGMFEPWAMDHKKWKKKLAWWLYERRILLGADLIHATAMSEAQNLRALGCKQDIVLIPNGVDFPKILPRPQKQENKTLLFISRIHKVKGLMNLLQAWAKLQNDDWCIRIAGPSEEGHREELEGYIADHQLKNISFLGSLNDSEKWQEYVNADLFVLPTHSENFGVVVAEAMAAGLPVITTKGAPWAMLNENNCGWWIDIGVEPLIEAIREAMNLNDDERQSQGAIAQKLAHDHFSWPKIGTEMNQVYDYVLGKGDRPGCVI
ncbi:glycosyltransferase [Lentisphaera profundi]|uniref:Glycosyltransferase n=1 Tax=Lentisphaera profundi TaxID=1658616 RepID=A0ABY7VWP9_9BACT|nr:glycosyltransferase [Lentisphaera profundi]WDE98209.1 glycosyltransferase [Lentisphaera profundi]